MDTSKTTSEIVEVLEELDPVLRSNNSDARRRYSIEDDINRLFQAFDEKISGRSSGQPNVVGRNTWKKSALKRPIGSGSGKVSGIGISEPVSLKQALRGLCISQAAEMAAMKRLSRPEAVTIKRLNRALVVEAFGSGASLSESKRKLVEVSIIPERITSKFSNEVPESLQKAKTELVNASDCSFITSVDPKTEEILTSGLSLDEDGKLQHEESSSNDHTAGKKISLQGKKMGFCKSAASDSGSTGCAKLSRPHGNSSSLIKPIFQAKNFVKKKAKLELTSFSVTSTKIAENSENDKVPNTLSVSLGVRQSIVNTDSNCCDKTRSLETISDGRSRSKEKGEFSQSSKSTLADYSCSPSISGQSHGSGSGRCGNNRPHMSKDSRWEAIRLVQNQHKILGLSNFKMLRKLGLGDIGTVYLAELTDTNCLFAVKVMDKDLLSNGKKMLRAQTEKEILHMLDHPFLPTLYTHFETDKFMFLVIDYCRGGDLHVLRQKQPSRNFSERAVRFYGAEVLLALEYLHMLGVVYRDLKPENILIREDGHIMLTDFDLSLRCGVDTKVLKSSSPITEPTKKVSSSCDENGCIHPLCLHPSWEVPCFTPKHFFSPSKSRNIKSDLINSLPQLVVEPISARSNSFVGTHEYLAPEIVKGEGHGNAVDWWTYGVLLFELLYGKTPFKGSSNEDTLTNIASQSLAFPDIPIVSFHARDLIRDLLIKEPENRLGSAKGAAEIKQHQFFGGLNWALIRSTAPPESTRFSDVVVGAGWIDDSSKKGSTKPPAENENAGVEELVEFELF